MQDRIRWGIHSTGHMAGKFAADLRQVPDAEVVAVASRQMPAARDFAQRHGIARCYENSAGLAADRDVDVVYLAAPAAQHAEVAIGYLTAGKPVLLEKPFTTTLADAVRVVAAARAAGVFLMEAMWMRFLPGIRELASRIATGAIGRPTVLAASFGRPGPFPAGHRLRRPELGGGALLDMGVYPLSLAHLLLGVPADVAASCARGAGGVDDVTSITLTYPGALAILSCSIDGATANSACVAGTDGYVVIYPDFIGCRRAALSPPHGDPITLTWPGPGFGYQYQVSEVHRCLREGALESSVMPLAETLRVMRTLDLAHAKTRSADDRAAAVPTRPSGGKEHSPDHLYSAKRSSAPF